MQYSVAVRTLCEFAARRGDLDLRFTPAPSAQQGMAGHLLVAGRRGPHYESEIPLRGAFEHLSVRGRADGYDPVLHRLEEIKTHRGDLARQPANHRQLHWAQAKVYGWLFCQARGLGSIELALVYFDIATQQETIFVETHDADALRAFFEACCRDFLAWAAQELAHRTQRDAALSALAFPHAAFHPGQRQLAESVYRGAASGRCLMAQAPTGIGKTIATVFGLLKAAAPHRLDKSPEVPAWAQVRGMDEGERQAFLDKFVDGGAGIGFAVLGGSFGEGIDLRGDRLVGAFVATLGLPQVNPRNERLKARIDGLFGAGYDYTYLVPGLQKVVQAAGRVIRTREDKGIVVLIDDRFTRPAVRELLPSWWRIGAPA